MLRVFGCPVYYHVSEDKLDPIAKKGVKCYKIWDPTDKKFILNRDVTFDETSMRKPTNSQQVESDATLPSLDRTVSLEITPAVTKGCDHVADSDAVIMRIKDRLWVMF